MSLLDIHNLSLSIHGKPILKGISLRIAEGEIVALTGESGSGKSMTAFATIGLLPKGEHATGELNFDGTNLLTHSEAAMCDLRGREIGMVFQEPMTALNPVQTIGAQVMETILIHNAMPHMRITFLYLCQQINQGVKGSRISEFA